MRGVHTPLNGFLLRTDIHRLFDLEYVIVSSDCRLKVSGRLKDRFNNEVRDDHDPILERRALAS
ncbi:HNH endonuclease [Bradyrhizobium sp. CCBAU 53415]|uniref:HNH endonuclease n=1 Tax=Bradyrhizobium sp. CCBAU 53415 TaxID=1325119 RepID=UPI002305797A|nr:HNH endonuclease [Bradyrhizobium sp. CCBAU 53415]